LVFSVFSWPAERRQQSEKSITDIILAATESDRARVSAIERDLERCNERFQRVDASLTKFFGATDEKFPTWTAAEKKPFSEKPKRRARTSIT
jgi:hypothetical protein